MPRLVNSVAQLPSGLNFQPVMRSIDSQQSLQAFNANNSTAISATSPSTISIRMNSSKWFNGNSSYFEFGVTCSAVGSTGAIATLKQDVSSLFRSLTVLNNGVVIEQIRELAVLNRIIALSQVSPASVSNWDQGYEPIGQRQATALNGVLSAVRKYTMQPIAGFLSSNMMIPLWALGEIEIRLELNTPGDGLVSTGTGGDGSALTLPDFTISNFKYYVELHDLPASYNRMVQDHISQAGLSYSVGTYDTISFNGTNTTQQDQLISNNAKSVKSVWAVMRPALNVNNTQEEYDFVKDNLSTHQLRIGGEHYPLEEMDGAGTGLTTLGSGAQSWKELVKSFQREGHYSSHFDISKAEYGGGVTITESTSNKFIIGYDLEKFCGSGLVCGTDFSENDIIFRHTYTSAPTSGNRWYFFVYKDASMTIVPNFNIIVAS